jgi:membrane protein
MVLTTVDEQSGFGLLSIGLLIALWSASNAIGAVVKAINRAYGLADKRGFIAQRAVALALTIGLSLLVITSFVLLVFGQNLGSAMANAFGFGGAFELLWNIARWPLVLILFMTALGLLYRFAPAEDVSRSTAIPGAISATILWIIATYGFSIYLTFADPGSAYGVIGGILVLLLFLYLSSIVIILGAELNATLYHRRHGGRVMASAEAHPQTLMASLPGARTDPEGSRVGAWVVLAILFVSALFGSLFKRDEGEGGSMDL